MQELILQHFETNPETAFANAHNFPEKTFNNLNPDTDQEEEEEEEKEGEEREE